MFQQECTVVLNKVLIALPRLHMITVIARYQNAPNRKTHLSVTDVNLASDSCMRPEFNYCTDRLETAGKLKALSTSEIECGSDFII
jgi:hypothetical protein